MQTATDLIADWELLEEITSHVSSPSVIRITLDYFGLTARPLLLLHLIKGLLPALESLHLTTRVPGVLEGFIGSNAQDAPNMSIEDLQQKLRFFTNVA